MILKSGNLNPNASNYTQSYYDFVGAESVTTLDQITGIGAAVNGDRTEFVHSLWYNTGREYNGYNKYDETQFRLQDLPQQILKIMPFSLVLSMSNAMIDIMVFHLLVYGR